MEAKGHDVHHTKFMYGEKEVNSYFIRHKYEAHMDPNKDLDKTNLGLYPRILVTLKNYRTELKKPLKHYAHMKEELSSKITLEQDPEKLKLLREEYENACFEWNKLDSKQKLLKFL